MLFKDKISDYCFTAYCCYLPPEYSPYGRDSTAFYTHLLSLMYLHNFADSSFIFGDLNGRIGDKNDTIHAVDPVTPRDVIDYTSNKHGDALLDFLIESRMVITNGRIEGNNNFTSISIKGKSVVDYFIIPLENISLCSSFNVMPVIDIMLENNLDTFVSERCKPPDHSVLILRYRISSSAADDHINNDVTNDNLRSDDDLFKRYNYGTISPEFLASNSWIEVLDYLISRLENIEKYQSEIDSFYNEMLLHVFQEMDHHIDYKKASKKSKKHYKNHKPYWTDELTIAWKNMSNSEKLYIKSKQKGPLTRNLYHDFMYKRKIFDRLLRNTERNYYRNKAMEIEKINTSNPTEFWNHIKLLGPKRKNNTIPMEVYDKTDPAGFAKLYGREEVLNRWKDDFYDLYNMPSDANSDFDNEFYERVNSLLPGIKLSEMSNDLHNELDYNALFTHDELSKVCSQMKLGKSAGSDLIPNEVLKHEGIRELLLNFVNMCFVNNIIPTVWRQSVIAPIPKSSSKDPCVPLNYRGISLLSCFYKLYTSLLNHRISTYCESNGLLVDEQNGFRAGRSCQDHIYVLSSIIRNRKSEDKDTFCAFVDFKKAFDWVPRDLLLYKLSTSFHIHGRLFNTLSTIYESSTAQIRLNGTLSDPFNVSSGVKQGDIISPVLFSMYLNDLATGIKELNCGIEIDAIKLAILLYADDIVLIAPNEVSLQKMIDFVSNWCKKWRMAINADKTQIVHFRSFKTNVTKNIFRFANIELKIVSHYKYLGVIFDEHLTFNENAATLADSALRALGGIRFKLKSLKEFGYNSFNTLFKSCVLSIADYSAGIWGSKVFPKTDQVQYRAARYFMGVHRFAPIESLLGDMGWSSSRTRHNSLILHYWNRLCKLDVSRLTRRVFDWDRQYSYRRGTWTYHVRHLLYSIDCEELFDSPSPCDPDLADSYLIQLDSQDWDINRYKSQKLRYYNLYKYEKGNEDYLNLDISKYQRSILAQFRCGILPLQIEVGRYRNVPLCDRLCEVCDTNSVEDEIHFLCECPCYSDLRITLFNQALKSDISFLERDNLEQFVFLMSNCQKAVITFLTSAVFKRTTLLNVSNHPNL